MTEVTGQCAACLDCFSVNVFLNRSRIELAETPRLKWAWDREEKRHTLLHTHTYGTLLAGKVHLYGSLERLLSSERQDGDHQSLRAVSPPAHLARLGATRF